jgi:RNA polymerase sigma-70 factor (ECF subfamily)
MVIELEYNEIYDGYYQKIVRYLSKIAGENDAEDLAQEVFEKISRSLDKFHGKSKLSTWIYRIATNTAIDKLRSSSKKHQIKPTDPEALDHSEDRNVWGDSKATPTDQKLIREEMSECVQEFIEELPPDYKAVLFLKEYEGLTNSEIGDILNISIDNVKIRLHRARTRLKKDLNSGCDFYQNDQSEFACDRKQNTIMLKMPR